MAKAVSGYFKAMLEAKKIIQHHLHTKVKRMYNQKQKQA